MARGSLAPGPGFRGALGGVLARAPAPVRGFPMRARGAVRVVPGVAVTVMVEDEGIPLAYGVVANISDQGACVWTNGRFRVGDNVSLRLSFAREPQPFEATARVVWGETPAEGAYALRYGLQWDSTPEADQRRLKSLIDGTSGRG